MRLDLEKYALQEIGRDAVHDGLRIAQPELGALCRKDSRRVGVGDLPIELVVADVRADDGKCQCGRSYAHRIRKLRRHLNAADNARRRLDVPIYGREDRGA